MPLRLRVALCWALVALGSLQMLGYVAHVPALRGLGMATAAAPLPLVFSHFRGHETFAARFSLELTLADGSAVTLAITPAVYARLGGPYNRRNAYGAAIAYGPGLTAPAERRLWQSVLRHGFCGQGAVGREFGIGQPVRHVAVHVAGTTAGRSDAWRLDVDCEAP